MTITFETTYDPVPQPPKSPIGCFLLMVLFVTAGILLVKVFG